MAEEKNRIGIIADILFHRSVALLSSDECKGVGEYARRSAVEFGSARMKFTIRAARITRFR